MHDTQQCEKEHEHKQNQKQGGYSTVLSRSLMYVVILAKEKDMSLCILLLEIT